MNNHSGNAKPKAAVGLKYEQNGATAQAPKVIAKGFGDIAEDIINVAKNSGVLIHEDEALIETLAQLDLGQDIPEELFHIIAELISFSYVLQGKFPNSWTNTHERVDDKV